MISLLSQNSEYPLHLLGWKAFQDISLVIAEECLKRPVQSFLDTNDGGRDGAFVGAWSEDDDNAGESTIQCKFTSKPDLNLTLSMLSGEIEKVRKLASEGLVKDYIILTNHKITGVSELKIKIAFKKAGAGNCRVFDHGWIVKKIKTTPNLRMMAPRLYGLGDLSELLDARAYDQARLILSAMGNDLEKLVITDAHKKSVKAITSYNFVLLLGAPAAGKSTIGASLAIGASDIWKSATIRATSPEDVKRHLSSAANQFFWIDDAWGNTQYQKDRTEAWNQIFPLMQAAMHAGSKFLITSRDYIWNSAQKDLKLHALPALTQSQVIINVEELSEQEKAQILYNHLKLGDQDKKFISKVKPYLPEVCGKKSFLPESARRLGSHFFTKELYVSQESVSGFFENPQQFLRDTIFNLAADCKAAIGLIFLNEGEVESPVTPCKLKGAADAFGVPAADVRDQLDALNGSLLVLMERDTGSFWTYKHPTISDAFSSYVASTPELIDIYLKGASTDSILKEVVCAGCKLGGVSVVIPDSRHNLLFDRLSSIPESRLCTFLSYRSNQKFSKKVIDARPSILERFNWFYAPLRDDRDVTLFCALNEQGLIDEQRRVIFVESARIAATTEADSSVIDDYTISDLLTEEELEGILLEVQEKVFGNVPYYLDQFKDSWDSDYDPENHFEPIADDLKNFAERIYPEDQLAGVMQAVAKEIDNYVADLYEQYETPEHDSAPEISTRHEPTELEKLFVDVDD
ncbi:hypothetical protein [Arenicella xantha]|uniref:Novel STAND NTPase 3 domain-containing protein n=1 Tax=Arenicella xantha TaxID=644221 RepID=A0A395JMV8_9GAMM|nr:hypothetical protein [Arenicella xantha]RBP52991.1 hypothetical protein DFR28_101375 [Arenicella xantha]